MNTNTANAITESAFFKGGNATFTVSNAAGKHHTFKIRLGKVTEQYPKPSYFVKLLTGPDNESSYSYLGIFNPTDYSVRLTAKSRLNDDSEPVKVVRWALKKVLAKEVLPVGYAIQHEGKCGCCGRTLTTPESIARGIGPECAEKMGLL